MGEPETFGARLEIQAKRLRASGTLGRSDVLLRLFDFLVTQTLAGRAPKEVEIAQEVFDKHGSFDVMLDASVRVYIHRLRRKIDDFYATDAEGGDRLLLPKGEYRLEIASREADTVPHDDVPVAVPRPARWFRHPGLLAAVVGLVAANLLGWLVVLRATPPLPGALAARSAFWSPLADNGRPTVLATGDYYIFGEAPDSTDVARLVREFSINSKDDLDQYLMAHPAQMGRYVDMGLHYLPTSIPHALRNIFPVIDRATGGRDGQELLIAMSQLTPDMLKKANIVYVGYLSGLGTLRNPVFTMSDFQVGSSYDELIDRRTGKRYVSDQGDVSQGHNAQRDFAYIASLPGPAGTRVLIIGGTRDAAVLQAAEIVTDPVQLDRLAAKVGNASAFEALYEVRTLDELNLGSKLIVAHGLSPAQLWNLDRMRQHPFPDQAPPAR